MVDKAPASSPVQVPACLPPSVAREVTYRRSRWSRWPNGPTEFRILRRAEVKAKFSTAEISVGGENALEMFVVLGIPREGLQGRWSRRWMWFGCTSPRR